MSEKTDKKLIERIRTGGKEREKAFKEIILSCKPRITSFLVKKGATTNGAKDIFFESLAELYDGIVYKDYMIKTGVYAYLHGISKNLWSQHLKAKGKNIELPTDAQEMPQGEEKERDEEHSENKKKSYLLKCLEDLQNQNHLQYRILVLFYFEKEKFAEIAKQLKINAANARKHAERGREYVRKCIEGKQNRT